MAKFKDRHDLEWTLDITVGAVKRVRDGTGVDLLAAIDGQTFLELADDPVRLVDVLWVLVESEASERDVTPEGFAELLLGDSLGNAVDAFAEAMTGFFTSPAQRKALGRAIENSHEVRDQLAEIGSKRIDEIDPKNLAEKIAKEHQPPKTSSD